MINYIDPTDLRNIFIIKDSPHVSLIASVRPRGLVLHPPPLKCGKYQGTQRSKMAQNQKKCACSANTIPHFLKSVEWAQPPPLWKISTLFIFFIEGFPRSRT